MTDHCPCGDYSVLKFFVNGGPGNDDVRDQAAAALEELHVLRARLKKDQ